MVTIAECDPAALDIHGTGVEIYAEGSPRESGLVDGRWRAQIPSMVQAILSRGWSGIQIDFEPTWTRTNHPPGAMEITADFVSTVAAALAPHGKRVYVDVGGAWVDSWVNTSLMREYDRLPGRPRITIMDFYHNCVHPAVFDGSCPIPQSGAFGNWSWDAPGSCCRALLNKVIATSPHFDSSIAVGVAYDAAHEHLNVGGRPGNLPGQSGFN